MNNAPSVLEIELTDEEVRENLVNILEDMQSLRQQQINENKLGEIERNEYVHLTYRLASFLESLAQENEPFVDGMQSIVDILNLHQELINYDLSHDAFWNYFIPDFGEKLDKVMSFSEVFLSKLSYKHHFLNALKYLASKNLSFEEKIRIHDSILPVNNGHSFMIEIYLVKN